MLYQKQDKNNKERIERETSYSEKSGPSELLSSDLGLPTPVEVLVLAP